MVRRLPEYKTVQRLLLNNFKVGLLLRLVLELRLLHQSINRKCMTLLPGKLI
jgi:hypothetical protein